MFKKISFAVMEVSVWSVLLIAGIVSMGWLLVGCGSLDAQQVAAEKQTYEVVAPQVEKWLDHEPGLTLNDPEAVEDWRVKLRSWKFRLDEAEKLVQEQE